MSMRRERDKREKCIRFERPLSPYVVVQDCGCSTANSDVVEIALQSVPDMHGPSPRICRVRSELNLIKRIKVLGWVYLDTVRRVDDIDGLLGLAAPLQCSCGFFRCET